MGFISKVYGRAHVANGLNLELTLNFQRKYEAENNHYCKSNRAADRCTNNNPPKTSSNTEVTMKTRKARNTKPPNLVLTKRNEDDFPLRLLRKRKTLMTTSAQIDSSSFFVLGGSGGERKMSTDFVTSPLSEITTLLGQDSTDK